MVHIRTPLIAKTARLRAKVKEEINFIKVMKLNEDPSEDEITRLVHFIIKVNSKIQEVIWKGGLLDGRDKFETLKVALINSGICQTNNL